VSPVGISNNLGNFSAAPKWLGIQKALAAPMPAPALGAPVPGTINGTTDAVGRVLKSDGFCGAIDVLYVLNSKAGGKFDLAIDGRSSGGNLTLTVGINGRTVGSAAFGSQPPSVPVAVSGGSVTLDPGVSALRISMPDPPHECIYLHAILVTAAGGWS